MSKIRRFEKDFVTRNSEYENGFRSLDIKLDELKKEVVKGPRECELHTELTDQEIRALVYLVELLPEKYGTMEENLALIGKYGPFALVLLDKALGLAGYK